MRILAFVFAKIFKSYLKIRFIFSCFLSLLKADQRACNLFFFFWKKNTALQLSDSKAPKKLDYTYFKKLLDFNSHCVMEATGYYHYQLAYYLQENSVVLSVENPLSVKRFIQMKLSKIKTDKSDSKLICEYAKQVDLKLWQGNSKHQLECL
jgi:hypothetical protein